MFLSVDLKGLIYPILLSCGLLSVWYVIPIFKIELRRIPYLKAPIVALVWTMILIFIPLYQSHSDDYFRDSILFYIYFFALAIPFDIKDIDFDSKNQRTIPQVFGVFRSKVISISLFSIFYVLFAYYNQEMQTDIFYWISLFYSILLIWSIKSKSSEIHFALIDSSMLLLGLSILIH
jgi:4-hydroxybenzoate polyprenyltransferase